MPNTIVKIKDYDCNVKEEDNNEDKNIKNIFFKRVGLKRKLKLKTALGTPKTTRISTKSKL